MKKKIPKEYKCSFCNSTSLYFENNFFCESELKSSADYHQCDDWSINDVSLIFSGILTCKACNEKHAVSGIGHVEEIYDEEYDRYFANVFIPQYFHPTLNIFEIPSNTPDNLKEIIKSAFSLAWGDFPAAGNRLRAALEVIINTLINVGSPKETLGNKINRIPNAHSDIRIIMTAIKWLGNEASHDAELIECDLAFAFEATELILKKLYPDTDKTKHILSLAEQINNSKGSFIK
ncbi:DUF4145 domain-containing protein [Photobacterium kishitanii]|uniref:DUF4145 domain-containing protein n=1 Tax=Photobacterium kishitanii TaxID=318456 RepID=UPI0005D38A78|nr:DUF4145 domain-containing protein [Photobacterium kishitanii]KJG67091.1 hypothetical protein UA40_03830 [Photobacterium kishitanii]